MRKRLEHHNKIIGYKENLDQMQRDIIEEIEEGIEIARSKNDIEQVKGLEEKKENYLKEFGIK